MTEKEFVETKLNGRTRYWDELVNSGRVKLEDLDDGQLKSSLSKYYEAYNETLKILDSYDYEAG